MNDVILPQSMEKKTKKESYLGLKISLHSGMMAALSRLTYLRGLTKLREDFERRNTSCSPKRTLDKHWYACF
jgi:hypothetical protein